MARFFDLAQQCRLLEEELTEAFRRVLVSGTFVLGSEVQRFERAFAAFCGTADCVGVGNGLDAIELLLRAHGVGPGDEVIVPAFTFVATAFAVSLVGAKPVFADVDAQTCNLDPASVAAAVTPRTRAVIAVHLYGVPAPMEPLAALTRSRGLLLLEDCAQAHGARYHGRPTGGLADGGAHSFYPTKNLGALGDAGAITTQDAALAERLRQLRSYGQREKYVHPTLGRNSRLDPLQAALLNVKLGHLDSFNLRRAEIAETYRRRLAGLGLGMQQVPPECSSAHHLFVVWHPRRDALRTALEARGVETLVHYPVPVHHQAPYGHPTANPALAVAERLSSQVLSLPLYPEMNDLDVAGVVDGVQASLEALANA